MARRRKSTYEVAGASKAPRAWSASLSAHIKRGILTSFDPVTYTANVLILEATNTYLQGVPLSYHMDGTSALTNNLCAVLFFDRQNYSDAVILAIYPGAGVGPPTYPPGRVTFVPQFQPVMSATINAGVTNTYAIAGSNNIPNGALGIIYHANISSATVGAYINLNAHGGMHNDSIGLITVAGVVMNGSGIIQLSSDGRIDISANGGNCVVNLSIHGYII